MDADQTKFWEEWANVGRDLLAYGEDIQYGMSLIEVKFQGGKPFVIVRSKSVKKKFPTNETAIAGIKKILDESVNEGFHGARTFTVALNRGTVSQVILDEYSNLLLK